MGVMRVLGSPVVVALGAVSLAGTSYAQSASMTFFVTSAGPGEGKTFVASNLAIAFAQAGRRVLLIDADLRRPSVHTIFGVSNALGLMHALFQDLDAANGHAPEAAPAGRRPDGMSIATTGMPEEFTSAITDSIKPDTGAFSPVPKMASTISVQSLSSEKCSSHA